MEIKFHIIVKLKGDLADLLKQVHIYQARLRMKRLQSLKLKEILTHSEMPCKTMELVNFFLKRIY